MSCCSHINFIILRCCVHHIVEHCSGLLVMCHGHGKAEVFCCFLVSVLCLCWFVVSRK
ncbi:hypothetical protein YC2023_010714 [Brassica napus]|uniref:Uncharacterized protein n=1 Tax=Brassica oleracea TaxID=3712 RepID=A0A3P6FQ30_BRAOL|nr:unnamed protein product [Brassica oleracea]